ncbi:MAG: AbrB/MazE/SpoVT family DNA-binding domain-containing protein [Nitrososphaerota archaeon]|nr:AbrB/MazE/SpoVT family DNA-binding domain-containing protein [Nitrososphaerota archaeon]
MDTVRVSKKYQIVIPERLREDAKIKPGDKMLAISKHGILQYIPVRGLENTKGMIKGLNTKGIRDEHDRL